MKKQILSEEFRRMQKLAGIIKEYVEDIYPDDQKRDMLDMLLNKYVKQALGMGEDERIGTHPNSDCIDSKWEAINNKFMATDWNQFSESDLRQAVQDANFKECLVVKKMNQEQ